MKTLFPLLLSVLIINPSLATSIYGPGVFDETHPPMKLADVPPIFSPQRPAPREQTPPLDCSKKNEKRPECREIINESASDKKKPTAKPPTS